MGWGIKIPSLGVDTGTIVGGDVGKGLTSITNAAKTPAGMLALTGGHALTPMLGDLMKYKGPMEPGANFEDITSKWDKISNSFVNEAAPAAIAANQQSLGVGQNNALSSLGQFGGQAVGAQDRLARQSKWGQAVGSGDIMQNARLAETQSKMQGIMGLDLPIQMGKDQAAAQARAARANAGGGALGLLGTIGGGIAGSFAGPAGAAAGASVGGALGQNLGRRS